MSRILLADDHSILRVGLKQLILDEMPDAVFGEAANAAETLERLHQQPWDVLVLDINMPGRNGFEVLAEVRSSYPRLPVLVLSSTPEDQLGLRCIKQGASGYLNKQVAPEQLLTAIRTVLSGGQFISQALAQKLIADLRREKKGAPHEMLSDRELQVCKLMGTGRAVKDIAAEMSLSPKTISTFRARVFEKLGVRNDVELLRYLQEHALE